MGVMSHLFHEYGPDCGEIAARKNGSLVSMDDGEATSYALNMVQERGRLMVEPGDNDLRRHDRRRKRARERHPGQSREGKAPDQHAFARRRQRHPLAPPLKLSLERALEYIDVDEFVEATPKNLRLRKKVLDATARKRSEQSRVQKFITE